MSQTLGLKNFDSLNIVARTIIIDNIAANVASLPVENAAGFDSAPVLIGLPGAEITEMLLATGSTSATTIGLDTNTALAHNFNTPVFLLAGSQLRIYRANDQYGTGKQPDDTNFVLIDTVNISASNSETTYIDPTGQVGMWYKYTYYNPYTQVETQLADSAAAQAGQTHYCSLDDIRDAAGFTNSPNVTDQRIAKKRAAAEQEVNGSLQAIYQLPLPKPTNPIVAEIAKQLAAGMLIHELYVDVSKDMAQVGESKANTARMGGGSFTGLQELVTQAVVLLDATFNDTSTDENVHGFGGYPDETFTDSESGQSTPYFSMDEVY